MCSLVWRSIPVLWELIRSLTTKTAALSAAGALQEIQEMPSGGSQTPGAEDPRAPTTPTPA